MANPNPSPSTRFRKGNPGGGRVRGLVRSDDLKRIFGKYWRMKRSEIVDAIKNSDLPAGELWVARIIMKGAELGDANRLNALLDRVIGRVKAFDEGETDTTFTLAYKE